MFTTSATAVIQNKTVCDEYKIKSAMQNLNKIVDGNDRRRCSLQMAPLTSQSCVAWLLDGSVTHSHTPYAGSPDASRGPSDTGEGKLVHLDVTQDLS